MYIEEEFGSHWYSEGVISVTVDLPRRTRFVIGLLFYVIHMNGHKIFIIIILVSNVSSAAPFTTAMDIVLVLLLQDDSSQSPREYKEFIHLMTVEINSWWLVIMDCMWRDVDGQMRFCDYIERNHQSQIIIGIASSFTWTNRFLREIF